jgi:hypothetical protein
LAAGATFVAAIMPQAIRSGKSQQPRMWPTFFR